MRPYNYIASILLLTVLLLGACVSESDIPTPGGRGKTVSAKVGMALKTADIVRTRTVDGTDAENTVETFHVFIFDRNTGMRIAHSSGIGGGSCLFTDLRADTYRFCVIGNSQELPAANYDDYWNAVMYYDDLKTIVLEADFHLPVGGDTKGGALDTSGPKMIMYGQELVALRPATPADPTGADYDTATCANIVLYENAAGMNPAAAAPWTYEKDLYIFPNLAGEVAADPANDQTRKGLGGENLETAGFAPAYLLVEGRYTYASGGMADVTQRVYLGQDNHSDFNVKRNQQHSYLITVAGADKTDTRVSVDGISRLEFTTVPEVQDAHYVMYPITFTNPDPGAGTWSWTLSVPVEAGTWATLKKEADLTDLQKQGYWTERRISSEGGTEASVIGTASVTGSGSGNAPETVYLFMRENLLATERTLILTLTDNTSGATRTFDVEQLPVNWNGNLGNERIEEYRTGFENGYPWGFDWTRTVTYQSGYNFLSAWWYYIMAKYGYGTADYGSDPGAAMTYQFEGSLFRGRTTYRIDYSQMNNVVNASDEDDGLANTITLYTGGAANLVSLEDYAACRMTLIEETGSFNDVEYFAAKMCVLKNKFNEREVSESAGGSTESDYVADIADTEIKWYLPARNQHGSIVDAAYPLIDPPDSYWTSTAVDSEAYQYIVNSGTGTANRYQNKLIRCVRNGD